MSNTHIILLGLSDKSVFTHGSNNIHYRPELLEQHPDVLSDEIKRLSIWGLVISSQHQGFLNRIERPNDLCCIILAYNNQYDVRATSLADSNVSFVCCTVSNERDFLAFEELERRSRKKPLANTTKYFLTESNNVFTIGSGVVNLIIALEVKNQGFNVTIFDKLPDPLTIFNLHLKKPVQPLVVRMRAFNCSTNPAITSMSNKRSM